MKKILSEFANNQVSKIKQNRGFEIPNFKVGDTVNVKYKITEGATTRLQGFKGVVIARTKNTNNYAATFTVRKISAGVGVERKFALYSPLLAGVEVAKQGIVRQSKIYYLRNLAGKASRIKEKLDLFSDDSASNSATKTEESAS